MAPFEHWSGRIDDATDEASRRALLTEIGGWRATRLTDIPAQREASWALTRVFEALGESERAQQEVQQLVALCRTPPALPKGAMRDVLRFKDRVCGTSSGERKKKSGDRKDKGDAWKPAVDHAEAGRWAKAREAVSGRRGPRASVFRVWTRLAESMSLAGDEREAALQSLLSDLKARALEQPTSPAASQVDSPLVALLGGSVPRRREPLIQALDTWCKNHRDRIDELAAAALAHHVADRGLKAPAPWLIGYVGRAQAAGEAPKTRAQIDEFAAQGAYAVTAYAEPGFGLAVAALRAASADGWRFSSMRRGVMKRGEGSDTKVWTLRLKRGRKEVLVALAPESGVTSDAEVAAKMARRIGELSHAAILAAPGDANAALRAACLAVKLKAIDTTAPDAIVAALGELAPSAPAREPKTREPGPLQVLRDLFTGDTAAEADAYLPVVKTLRRMIKGFSAIREPLVALEADEADRRLAPLLRAMHDAAPEFVGFGEGRAMALRVAARQRGGAVESVLRADGTSKRYAGPGLDALLEVVATLDSASWTLDRVTTGATRREEQNNAALAALQGEVHGLWRLQLLEGDRRTNVWVLSEATPEANAATAMLLTPDAGAVLVTHGVDLDAEVLGRAASHISWADGAGASLVEAAQAAAQQVPPRTPSSGRSAAAPAAETAPAPAEPVAAAPAAEPAAAEEGDSPQGSQTAASDEALAGAGTGGQAAWHAEETLEVPPADD